MHDVVINFVYFSVLGQVVLLLCEFLQVDQLHHLVSAVADQFVQ